MSPSGLILSLRFSGYGVKSKQGLQLCAIPAFITSYISLLTSYYCVLHTFSQEAFQQEGKEVGKRIELTIPSDILVPQFHSVFYFRIRVPFDKVIQRSRSPILSFYLYRYQRIGIANKEIHLKGRALVLVEIQLFIARLTKHLSNNVLIYCTFVGSEVLVGAQVLLCFFIERGNEQACIISTKSHFRLQI